MSWYKLNLGDGQAAFAPTRRIQDAWMAAAMSAARLGVTDHSSAIFSRTEGESLDIVMYFTPGAKLIASAFGATPCEKPPQADIRLTIGDGRAWDIHFPGALERRSARHHEKTPRDLPAAGV